MANEGKRYLNALKTFDRAKYYTLEEAVAMAQKLATAKFDETIELHFRLGIDPRHSDQQVRSTVMLPHGLGKKVRILAFAEGEDAKIAQEAGADVVGADDIIAQIQGGWMDFDASVATPSMMAKVGKVARILGPRGLMPNPKAGTVVPAEQMARAINELKAGRLEFRNDKTGNVHMPVGKASFDAQKLLENARAAVEAVISVKPANAKGVYMRRLVVASTMGPGIRVQL